MNFCNISTKSLSVYTVPGRIGSLQQKGCID